MPIGRQRLLFSWSVGFCLSASGYDFDAFFVDFGLQLGTLGAQKMHPEPKNDHFGAPLAGAGPRDRFLVNLGCILGAILETILHTGGHLWQLVASFRYSFVVMFFIWFRVPAVGGPMWLKHSKYHIRMRFSMLGKGSILSQFWSTFGTHLVHF